MKIPQFGAGPSVAQKSSCWCQWKGGQVVGLREIVMILEWHRQGLGVRAIAPRTGLSRKTVRKYFARGLAAPVYGPREPGERLADRFQSDLAERLEAFPGAGCTAS